MSPDLKRYTLVEDALDKGHFSVVVTRDSLPISTHVKPVVFDYPVAKIDFLDHAFENGGLIAAVRSGAEGDSMFRVNISRLDVTKFELTSRGRVISVTKKDQAGNLVLEAGREDDYVSISAILKEDNRPIDIKICFVK